MFSFSGHDNSVNINMLNFFNIFARTTHAMQCLFLVEKKSFIPFCSALEWLHIIIMIAILSPSAKHTPRWLKCLTCVFISFCYCIAYPTTCIYIHSVFLFCFVLFVYLLCPLICDASNIRFYHVTQYTQKQFSCYKNEKI